MIPYQNEIEFGIKVIAFLGAAIAVVVAWKTHSERSTFEMIDRLYTLCHTLESHALREWYLSHLFCIGDKEYQTFKERIQAQALKEPGRCSEFQVKEKLFAIHVFIIYEQVYYQWCHTSRFMHRQRHRFLCDILAYFTDRLLQNPRLLAILKEDPEGVSIHLEGASRKHIDAAIARCVVNGKQFVDYDGPFAVCPNPLDASMNGKHAAETQEIELQPHAAVPPFRG